MRVDHDGAIVLSRRNLLSLLAKLDGHPPWSARTIVGGEQAAGVVVSAEDDETHYGHRGFGPGVMHPETEVRLEARRSTHS